MEPVTLALGILRIGWFLWENVIKAEQDPELSTGNTKHQYVEQSVLKEIEGLDLPSELKTELERAVAPGIKQAVDTYNKQGVFAHGASSV